MIVKNKINSHGELVNFGSGKQYSNFEILKMCEKVFNKKAKATIKKKFQRKYDKKIWCANTKYLRSKIKFKKEFSIQRAIKDYKDEIIKDTQPLFFKNRGKRISFAKF